MIQRLSVTDAITAVICTRNRGDAARVAAQSVLSNRHANFRLIVVDQSTNNDCKDSLSRLASPERLTYFRTTTVGLSRARNIGLREADSEVVAFTDDDCEVPNDWLDVTQSVFAEQPRTLVMFCSVRAGPHDAATGFVPIYECRGTKRIHTVLGKCTARGMGAGLAVRRRELLSIGGFDEQLGAGAVFPAAEDYDVSLRALLAGYEVCETDRTHVIHHGFRPWGELRSLARRDWTGIGAACAKPLRAGSWRAVPVALYELGFCAVWPPIRDIVHFRRPRGVTRGLHYLRGFAEGFATPVDRRALLYAPERRATTSPQSEPK
jgi:GT2 family glycosyltransferase